MSVRPVLQFGYNVVNGKKIPPSQVGKIYPSQMLCVSPSHAEFACPVGQRK